MTEAVPVKVEIEQATKDRSDPLWYKDAIIYQIHVKAFFDSNNDGIGDFGGLAAKLDYLQELGVTAIWLLPFYPSPLRDDGYDIADYCSVNPSYGTLAEFQFFVDEAHKRGLRVITELVINHTSDQHPWFQRARAAPAGSPEREFYVWSDTDQKYLDTRIIFSDTETSNWAWDPVAKAYYWHRFFSHQPDLNFDNPEVLRNVIEIMYFWLDMGVDGLRLDAVPYLCEREGTSSENLPETHDILKKIREALDQRYPDRMLLAEANQWPEDVLAYFGKGDECHMAFNFPLMPRIYMAVAQEDRHPITDIMDQTPVIPPNCQWAVFLRNHDELTLEMVTNRERDYLWNFYAADKRARINFGIRRRLAPLMENDRRKIELLNGLLLSMPGTPVFYYGDELGMGDNIYLGDRNGVRTPMQWSPDRNGGFSRSDPERLYLPAVMDPIYGYQTVNVETQKRVQYSLLSWMRNLISVVKTTRTFGRGTLRFLSPANRSVLAYLREHEGECILCTANLSRSPQAVELDMKEFRGLVPVELLGNSRFPAIGELPYLLTLAPFGFYWFRLTKAPQSQIASLIPPELFTLVLPSGREQLFNKAELDVLRKRLLPAFLLTRRWYKAKHAGVPTVEIVEVVNVGGDFRILVLDVGLPDAPREQYIMGIGIAWDEGADDPLLRLRQDAICKTRRFNRVGVLYEATRDESFIVPLIGGFSGSRGNASVDDRLRYEALPGLGEMHALPVKSLGAEQTNSSAIIGDRVIIKFIHQPPEGESIEEEFCRYLTHHLNFSRSPKLLGSLRLQFLEKTITVALLEEAIPNQGDGWKVTLSYLDRMIRELDVVGGNHEKVFDDTYYDLLARKLGERTGELHKALLTRTEVDNFKPEPVDADDRMAWIAGSLKMLDHARRNLLQARGSLTETARTKVDSFLSLGEKCEAALRSVLPATIRTPKIRVHGDYHLGQVLVGDNDFYIIDFEGEPARTLGERRLKMSPLKDVAAMIRSFDYAGATALQAANLAVEGKRPEFEALIKVWSKKAEDAFWSGYHDALPLDDTLDDQLRILRFFKLEKAIYELVYESQHRPGWVEIPLQSVLDYLQEAET